ncbi:DUF4845 domain-containing protein [Pseudomonas sp. N040]|uniref:DUF4845 domain-containing protein n=1 Tax=Pseudomonas sp. N040 TaxID=2785325 RepID=UPI0018A32EFE|nr:DUF4845 domain-containing protein [Pseudomonas sp. N040]MBF7731631.1 DUF4845 domain-containing protein [Pseudomonas sp. N040]MBW7015275.1 DUF4845 domain-containing protein [Pseudomonas sp. N040]
MSFPKSQKGMSALGVMVALAFVAFFLSAGLKMLPHYMDNRSLAGIIEKVQESGAGEVNSIAKFYEQVRKGMTINAIRDIDLEKVLELKIENNEFRAHLKYEKREVLIGNLDLIARFDKEFRVRMP